MSVRHLRIYLNDQLALGVAGRELASRAARENAGSEIGAALAEVAAQVTEDIATLEAVMQGLAVPRSRVKPRLGALAERAGRLKLNGSLRRYSPLSRFQELDLLLVGVRAKRQLWTALRDLAALPQRVPGVDLDDLVARAEAQIDLLEPCWVQAGLEAFGNLEQPAAFPA
ncbi:MAG TPA: hypothetical protein VGK92_10365 [Gaiellales bacterium]|jgi:hypothetical protein